MKQVAISPFHRILIPVLFVGLVACGNRQPADPPVFPTEVVAITHPDLAGLEDQVAKPALEEQKKYLADTLAKKDATPKTKAEAFGRIGALYMAFSYRDTAETCFRNAYATQPDNFLYAYLLGHLYREINQPEKSLAFLERAHQLKADYAPIKYYLGEAYRNAGQEDKAKALFEEVLQTAPELVHAHLGLGLIAASSGEHEKAIEHFVKILTTQARASAIHYYIATSYQALGKQEEAEKHLALHGNVKPYLDDPQMQVVYQPRSLTHYVMAENLRIAGLYTEAVAHYDLVVELDPTNPGPRMGRALNLIAAGQHFEAVVRMQDDITVLPNMLAIHHMLARLSASSNDDRVRSGQRALGILKNLKEAGITAELTETLAMAYAEIGRFDDAVLAQQKAIEMAKEAKDEAFAAHLAPGVQKYRDKQPCREPWPEDDPLFKMVTFDK